jgi:hypothetical protein
MVKKNLHELVNFNDGLLVTLFTLVVVFIRTVCIAASFIEYTIIGT